MMQKNIFQKAPGVQKLFLSIKLSALVLFATQLLFLLVYFNGDYDFEWGIFPGVLTFGLMTLALMYFFAAPLMLWIFPLLEHNNAYASAILSSAIQIFIFTLQVVDLIYFQFTQKHATFDLLRLIQAEDFSALILSFMKDYWWVFLLSAGLIIFIIYGNLRLLNRFKNDSNTNKWKMTLYGLGHSLWILPLFLLIGRGGFQPRPRTILDAHLFVSAKNSVFVLNTPFTFITTLGMEGMTPFPWQEDANLVKLLPEANKMASPFKTSQPNIVVLILESFSAEALQSLDTLSKKNTPFLDSLSQYAWNYTNAYANGLRSVDALPAIMSGLPSLMEEAYLFSPYAAKNIHGLPNLLPDNYTSQFFHGAQNGSMNFESYCYQVGLDQYFGKNEYVGKSEDYDGTWGIFDEPFLQFSLDEMLQNPEPFFASVFTLSSHPPYTIPKGYEHLKNTGDLPIESSIKYTDAALKSFFEAFKKHPQFERTIFIITADHVAPELPKKRTDFSRNYWIPLMVYHPNQTTFKKYDHAVQQSDILQTVLNYTNSKSELQWPFSMDLNDTTQDHVIMHYRNLEYTLSSGENRYYYQAPDQWYEAPIAEDNQRVIGIKEKQQKQHFQFYLQYFYNYFNRQP